MEGKEHARHGRRLVAVGLRLLVRMGVLLGRGGRLGVRGTLATLSRRCTFFYSAAPAPPEACLNTIKAF